MSPRTASSFEIKIGPGLKEFEIYIERLVKGGLRKITKAAAYDCAMAARRMVKLGYQTASYERRPGTLAQYAFGGGGSKRWMATEPLQRSRTLMNSVVVRRVRSISEPAYTVQIHPTKTYTRGDPKDTGKKVAAIAEQMENPKPIIVKVTTRMLRYLHWLNRKAGAKEGHSSFSGGKGNQGAMRVGSLMIYYPSAKPVWKQVKREIGKIRPSLAKSIQHRLQIFRYNPGRATSMRFDLK